MLTRRAFLHTTSAAGTATLTGISGLAGAGYDLVIIGGRVSGGKPVRSRS